MNVPAPSRDLQLSQTKARSQEKVLCQAQVETEEQVLAQKLGFAAFCSVSFPCVDARKKQG